MKKLIQKNKEVIMYLIFGVLTTLVNIVVYYILNDLLHIHYMVANVIAWIASVLFAYITNRKYVFESNGDSIIQEFSKFVSPATLSTFSKAIHFVLKPIQPKIPFENLLYSLIDNMASTILLFIKR